MKDYRFDGSMTREVLENYLSRAVTHTGLTYDNHAPSRTFEDDLRMLLSEGAKFIGRCGLIWRSTDEEEQRRVSRERAEIIHRADPDIILQGCVFECIWKPYIDSLPVPAWVFEEFGLPAEERNFRYDAMLYPDGTYVNHWGEDGGSVEDIRQTETRMYIYYRARCYIDDGFEAIHFGQVHLIGAKDEGFRYWKETLGRVRRYAKEHARRHFVLCDAHTHGITVDGEALFDYNAWPLRLKEIPDKPLCCVLEKGYFDSIWGRSHGGKTPSGWEADPLPYLVEFDNFDRHPGAPLPTVDSHYAWGYDEIDWLMLHTKEERAEIIRYVYDFIRNTDPCGHLEMPSRRCLTDEYETVWDSPDTAWLEQVARDEFLRFETDGRGRAHIFRRYYSANNPSDACPFGLGDEAVITALWREEENEPRGSV